MAAGKWQGARAGVRMVVVSAVVAGMALLTVPAQAAPSVQEAQWHIPQMRIEQAQQISDGKGVVVGVVDTGVDAGHTDLSGQVLPGLDMTGEHTQGRADSDSHGTEMAGLIAAKGGGPGHALGVAPGARILPIRMERTGSAPLSRRVQGIRWAVDHGAKVINLSWIAAFPKPSLTEAIRYASSHDVVVVAAAGNTTDGDSRVESPASIPGVVAVTGLNTRAQFWSGSTSGPEAVVCAPAQNVVSTGSRQVFDSGYTEGNGTSNSTAIVSGVVALIRSKYPDLDAANVINRLIRTAHDWGPPGRDPQYGFGEVSPVNALTESVPTVTKNPLGAPYQPSHQDGDGSSPDRSSPDRDSPAAASSGSGIPTGPRFWGPIIILVIVVLVGIAVFVARRNKSAKLPSPQPVGAVPPLGPPSGVSSAMPEFGGMPGSGPGGGRFGPPSGGAPQGPDNPSAST
ncbi:MAG: type VII secretion-associated serine protease mycosin [Actinocatenispora sp.]